MTLESCNSSDVREELPATTFCVWRVHLVGARAYIPWDAMLGTFSGVLLPGIAKLLLLRLCFEVIVFYSCAVIRRGRTVK